MEQNYEYCVPFYNFSVVVRSLNDASDYRFIACDNGHSEIAVLSKFDTFDLPSNVKDYVFRTLGIHINRDREYLAYSNVSADDAAKKLITAILCLIVFRENNKKPLYGAIEVG